MEKLSVIILRPPGRIILALLAIVTAAPTVITVVALGVTAPTAIAWHCLPACGTSG